MKTTYSFNSSKGFTIIEAVVVTIIIAILIAFLVPLYQHMIMQSNFSTLMPVGRTVVSAQEAYYLNAGHYADALDGLDINYKDDKDKISLAFSNEEGFDFVMLRHQDVPNNAYIMYFEKSENFPGNVHCEAKTNDSNAMWLCEEGLAGTALEHGSISGTDYTTFILSGESADGHFTKTYYSTSNVTLTNGDSCISANGSGCTNVEASGESTCVVESGGSGCANSTFSDNSTCEAQSGSGASCQDSTFTGNSSCEANSAGSCAGSNFSSSTCEASGGNNACGAQSTYTNGSICYGNKPGVDRPNNSCGNSIFRDSTCTIAENATSGYICGQNQYHNSLCYSGPNGGCGGNSSYYSGSKCYGNSSDSCDKSTFEEGSYCYGEAGGGCKGSTFKHAVCDGKKANSCTGNVYQNNTVCYARAKGSCTGKNGNSSYQSGSYCDGEYCPAGSPKPNNGGTWQACPNAGNTGRTC